MAVNTECQEAVLLLLEHGADIDAVVSALGPGRGVGVGGGWGWVRLEEQGGAGPTERGSKYLRKHAGPSRWDAGLQLLGQSKGTLKTFLPCRRTLRAAAPHSSTPWKTTA